MTAGPRNVVVIISDQQRADLCVREGFGLDTAPFADHLATQGTWFNRAYTTSPLCCPARTSLLTGRYPSAHGVRENPAAGLAHFDRDLPAMLRAAGHTTALIGKNHTYLSADDLDRYTPFLHGGAVGGTPSAAEAAFDSWLTGLRHRTHPEPTPFPVELQCPYRIVSAACDWLDSVGDRPFFLLLSFPEPHNPYQVPEPYFSMFPPETLPPVDTDDSALADRGFAWRYLRRLGEAANADYANTIGRARSNYCGMLRLIDDQIGRFVGHLRQRGLDDDTLLMVTADHGDFVGEYGLLRKGAELPEVLTRVPLIVTGPGVTADDGPHTAHVSLADLLPTIAEATGLDIDHGVQGRSLWPMLTGRPYPAEEFASAYAEQGMGGLPYTADDVPEALPGLGGPDDLFDFDELNAVTQSGQQRMVRRGDWKLVVDNAGGGQLYDLSADPRELVNLWDRPQHLAVRAELLHDLSRWMLRAADPLPVADRGYPRKRAPHNYRRQ